MSTTGPPTVRNRNRVVAECANQVHALFYISFYLKKNIPGIGTGTCQTDQQTRAAPKAGLQVIFNLKMIIHTSCI